MKSLRLVQLNITIGLAVLLLAALLWWLWGMTPAYADPGILYVDGATGQDVSTCGATGTPCKTISYALNNRASGGDTIRVAQGVYTENLTINISITLEGGYEPTGWTRNITSYETVIDGSGSTITQSVVTFLVGSNGSMLDGFTVRNGEGGWGGGIFISGGWAGAQVTVQNCTVISNSAYWMGGGINVVEGANATITNNRVLSNTSAHESGGINVNWSTAAISHNTIAWNLALGSGGIGFWGKCSGDVYANLIAYNQVGNWGGGGMSIGDGSVVTAVNNIVAHNVGTAMRWDGDGVLIEGDATQVRLVNNTIVSNTAEGIQANQGTVLARNNIIYGNNGGIHNYESGATVSSDHNAFWNNGWDYANVVSGTGDTSANPLFVDTASGNYHLQADSPCIDAGTPTGAPSVDIEGTPRDTAPDIGAYEWGKYRIFLPLTLRNVGS